METKLQIFGPLNDPFLMERKQTIRKTSLRVLESRDYCLFCLVFITVRVSSLQLPLPITLEQGEPRPQDLNSRELTPARSSPSSSHIPLQVGRSEVRRSHLDGGGGDLLTTSHLEVTLTI